MVPDVAERSEAQPSDPHRAAVGLRYPSATLRVGGFGQVAAALYPALELQSFCRAEEVRARGGCNSRPGLW